MALITCPKCGNSIPEEADKCTYCGAPLSPGQPQYYSRGAKAVFEAKDVSPVTQPQKAKPTSREKHTPSEPPTASTASPSGASHDQASKAIDIGSLVTGMMIVGLIAAGSFAWVMKEKPTPVGPEPQARIAQAEPKKDASIIQSEIAALQSRITANRQASSQYTGGLIKNVLDATLAIQQQNPGDAGATGKLLGIWHRANVLS